MRKGSFLALRALPALLFCISALPFAGGQTGSSSITGTIRHAALKACIANAVVTAVNEETGIARTATTNADGLYEISFLAAGSYTVRAEMSGFAKTACRGVRLGPRQTARVDFSLKPAPGGEEFVMESNSTPPAALGSEIGGSIVREEVRDLPLLGRDFAGLQILAPGVQPASSVGLFAGRELSEGFRIAGGTMYSSVFSVEQADSNRTYYFGNAASPSLEIVRELRVLRAGISADMGGGASYVDLSLKGGSKAAHGSVFEYLQHDRLNARNAMSSADPPHLRRSQFGVSVSGPVKQDKLFIFGAYEGLRLREGATTITQVATVEQRNGLFPLAGAGAVIIRDPASNLPFPGNQIPESRISPLARYFLERVWPLPNLGADMYREESVPLASFAQVDAKLDYIQGAADSFSLRVSRTSRAFSERIEQSLISPRTDRFDHLSAAVRYTKIVGPSMVNSLLLAARRDDNTSRSRAELTRGPSFAEEIGLVLGGPAGKGYPQITISGRGFAGQTGQLNTPVEHSGTTYQIQNTLRWIRGRRGISLGFEVKRFHTAEMEDIAATGRISFNGRYSGSGLADFLLGLPNQFSYTPPMGRLYLRNTLWAAFVQQDWKIGDDLTLHLGIRYEYLSWPVERYDRMATSHPELGMRVIVASSGGHLPERVDPVAIASYPAGTFVASREAGLPRSLRFPDRNNFGPRAGLAYRVAGDTVIRASYGIDFLKESQAVYADRDACFGLPFRIVRTIANPNPLTFNILRPFEVFSPRVRSTIDSAFYFDPRAVMAYVQTWSLALERPIPLGSALRIGYVGNRMVHGRQILDWNQSLTWPNWNDRFAGYTNISALTDGGDSRYDSLQAEYRREIAEGLLARASYTWSKTLTNMVEDGNPPSIWVHDPSMQWGRSPWDRKHVLTGNFIYRLPFGKESRWLHSLPWFLDAILGRWQVSGIVKVMSGRPLTITSSLARAHLSVRGIVPADRLADGRLPHPNSGRWFDQTAFATPPADRPGNAGYGILDGPGLITEDLAFYRSFSLREGAKLQFRLEAYNAFNHVNLSEPVTDVDNWTYLGKILTSGPALRLQAALRLDF